MIQIEKIIDAHSPLYVILLKRINFYFLSIFYKLYILVLQGFSTNMFYKLYIPRAAGFLYYIFYKLYIPRAAGFLCYILASNSEHHCFR